MPLVLDHLKDVDCVVDPVTGLCRECGVYHGDPCPGCGGRGFHSESCPALADCQSRRD